MTQPISPFDDRAIYPTPVNPAHGQYPANQSAFTFSGWLSHGLTGAGGGEARSTPEAGPKPGRVGVALCLAGALGLLGVGGVLLFSPGRAAALDAASAVTLSGSGIALALCAAVMGIGLWLTLRKK